MKPIDFEQSNKELTKPEDMTAEECGSRPVWCDGTYCVSCWEFTWKERLKLLFKPKIWLWIKSGHTQPPIAFSTNNPWPDNG